MIAAVTTENVTTALALGSFFATALTIGWFRNALTQLKSSNAELRSEVVDIERRADADRRECDKRLAEMDAQVSVLTTEFSTRIAASIADEWSRRQDVASDNARRKAYRQGDTP